MAEGHNFVCHHPTSTEVSEGCRAFQHLVRRKTLTALSFINKFYHSEYRVCVLPINGTCTEYTSVLKNELNRVLISCLGGKNPIQGVDSLKALSYGASIASVTKGWPDNCPCMEAGLEAELRKRITKEKMDLPEGYIDHVRSVVKKVFPRGIRRGTFWAHAKRVTPPFSSTTEKACKDGGSYASWNGMRADYLSMLERPEVCHEPTFMVAKAAGKPRPLVKNHPSYLLLRPIHTAMYDHLSKQPWLLRGPPTANQFLKSGFSSRRDLAPNKQYLSADFTAATDSLSIEVAETIFDELAWLSSPDVLPSLAEAKKSLRPKITIGDEVIEPSTGQMMGNLCSFPLLCLQNYCAATWVDKLVGEDCPKLINGDDLLVEASDRWYRKYKQISPTLGMNLNEKKTSYSRTFLTINSTYFSANFKEIPFVRSKGLQCSDPREVGVIMGDILKPYQKTRHLGLGFLVRLLVNHFKNQICISGRSLRKLGFRTTAVTHLPSWAKRRERERYQRPEEDLPRDRCPMGLNLVQIDDKFNLIDEKEVAEAVVAAHWDGGQFVREKRMKMRAVIKKLRDTRTTRGKRVKTRMSLATLLPEKQTKKIWIPEKLADCYTQCHDTSMVHAVYSPDGNQFWLAAGEPCQVCERVRSVIRNRSKGEERNETLLMKQSMGGVVLSDPQADFDVPDMVWRDPSHSNSPLSNRWNTGSRSL